MQSLLLGLVEIVSIIVVCWKYDEISIKKLKSRKLCIASIAIAILTLVFNYLLLKQNYRIVTSINLIVLYVIVSILAFIDSQKKMIPNLILGIGFLIRIALLLYEGYRYPESITVSVLSAATGFGFGLLFLLLLSFITKHGIGYGDVKMFAWLGFCVGLVDVYNILFYSVLAAAFAGIYLLLIKKVEWKKQLPFAPFVYVGSYMVFVLTFLRK